MKYDITFQVDGEEQTERIEAPDAATAASRIRNAHATDDSVFELLLVHLVEDEASEPGSETMASHS